MNRRLPKLRSMTTVTCDAPGCSAGFGGVWPGTTVTSLTFCTVTATYILGRLISTVSATRCHACLMVLRSVIG